jgi:heptosyltransferase-2
VKEVNWLGDVVISLPAVHALRRFYPEAHFSILIREELAGFFDGIGWVDEVIPYRSGGGAAGLLGRVSLWRQLRAKSFDLGFALPRSFESALWLTLAGVRQRVGVVADHRRWLLTRSARVDMKDPARHQSLAYFEILHRTLRIPQPLTAPSPSVQPSTRHRDAIRSWLRNRRRHGARLIALAPAAAYGPAKEWPAVYFAQLIELLAERGCESVLVGAPSEQQTCVAISESSRGGALVAAGKTSVGELLALLAECDGFAGNDSGAMHVAAALGVPTVGIFGSTNPVRTGPLGPRTRVLYEPPECSPCLERTCRFGHYDCLHRITPAAVLDALTDLGVV